MEFATLYDSLGECSFEEKTIRINNDGGFESVEDCIKIILHETQHAIQGIEKFAEGSSNVYWEDQIKKGNIPRYKNGRRMKPGDAYLLTAGEIEARDVEERLKYEDSERESTRPDIDNKNVIFVEKKRQFLSGYNEMLKQIWKEKGNVVPYENEADLINFVDKVIDDSKYKADLFIGKITRDFAINIAFETGLPIEILTHKNIVLKASSVRDQARTSIEVKENFAKIVEVICFNDAVEVSANGKTVYFEKNYDDKNLVVALEVDENKDNINILSVKENQKEDAGASKATVQYSIPSDHNYVYTNGKASFTEERLNNLFDEHSLGDGKRAEHSNAYVGYISPEDFVNLTANKNIRGRVEDEAYVLNEDELKNEKETPFLEYDPATGEVVDHEGRHRMVALKADGIESVAVVLKPSNDSFERRTPGDISLAGQNFAEGRANGNVTVKKAIPLSEKYRTEAVAQFAKNPDADVRYSIPDVDKTNLENYNKNGGESDVEKESYNNSGRTGKRNSNSQSEVGRIQTDDDREHSQVETDGSIGRSTQMLSNKGNKRVISKEQKDHLKTTAIKNKKGTPKKVYHYTENMEFTTFGKGDIGFHFGSKLQAENRGNQLKADGKGLGEGRIIQTFLDIKNPIHIPMDIMNWNAGPLAMRLYGDGIISEIEYLTILQAEKQFGSNYDSLAAVELRRILNGKGYDGVVYQNMFEGDGESYIAFYPEQVIIIDDGLQADPIDGPAYSLPEKGRGQYAIPDIARGKSYAELRELINNGEITSDEALDSLAEQHGEMPKGENPKVDVTLPEKISETKNVNQFMRNVLESGHLDAGMTETEKRNIISGARTYKPISDKAALGRAEEKIKSDVNGAVQEWENLIGSGKFLTKFDMALGEQLLVQAAESGNANDVTRYIAELADIGTQSGQVSQALRLLKQMTGIGQLYYVTRAVARLNKDIVARYGEKHKIVEIDPHLASILANSKSEAEIDSVVEDLIKDVASQVKSSWVDKFNSWRYLAMLGNPRTHFRNIVGNGVFVPAVGTKNKIAAIAEKVFIKQENRTKVFGFLKPEYRAFATEDFAKIEDILKSGGKMNPTDQIRDQMKVFNTKLFESARTFNFNMLEKEDGWFLKGHYIRALGGALQARGLDINNITPAQLEELRTYAIKEAQKATYRDVSHFAQILNKLAHPGKDASIMSKAAGVAVEGLLPFKKTPINILKRGIEYSPIGIATSIADAFVSARKGEFSGAQLIDGLSAGLTGTGIMLLGALCMSLGFISGGMDYEDEDALERMAGAQPYAINFGDFTYTIDFAAPAVLPFMIGAETAKIFSGEGNDEALGFFDAVAAIGAPMTELSMLQGLNDAIETIAYSDNKMGDFATNIFASYFSQYIPTLGGQIARTFDDTKQYCRIHTRLNK